MGRIALGVFAVWLVGALVLFSGRYSQDDWVRLYATLPLTAPLLVIAVLTVLSWIEKRWHR